MLQDPDKAETFKHVRDCEGRWVVRDDVWCRFHTANGVKKGPLTIGFTAYPGSQHIGPEFQFGHIIGDAIDAPVLLIKTAWLGKSLYEDFRPPSAGGETGTYYTKMLAEVQEALESIEADFPTSEFKGSVTFVKTTAFACPAEQSPNTGHGHHWYGNAESYFLIGDALGRAMAQLIRKAE